MLMGWDKWFLEMHQFNLQRRFFIEKYILVEITGIFKVCFSSQSLFIPIQYLHVTKKHNQVALK